MTLHTPPQTIARAGVARAGGTRFAYIGGASPLSRWTEVDPTAASSWTRVGGEPLNTIEEP